MATVIDGRFALEREHRRGGMGTVWLGRDLTTSRPVAIKLLHSTTLEQSERFQREATLLAELAHGSIVSYVSSGRTSDGVPYLAMEWLEGETLAERLATRPLALRDTLVLAQAVASGLAVAHRRGIVHRDLKPSNLFLRGRACEDVVLLDLGIARRVSAGESLTQAGAVLGTPSYMAPEQAQGDSHVSPAADVFSLGCVIFECLAGAPPFTGQQVITVLAKVLFEDTPSLRELRPELPAALCELVARMLAKKPEHRPAHADAVLAALAGLERAPDLAGPSPSDAAAPTPRPSGGEQQLLSVIVATREPGGDAAAADTLAAPPLPDVTPYGAEQRLLSDGTLVLTLEETRGAATDLAIRAARCALRVRDVRPGWHVALATGRALQRGRVHLGEAVDRAAALLAAHAGAPAGQVWLDAVTAGLLGARFQVRDDGLGPVLDHEEATVDPSRPLLGQPTACVGREHELGSLELSLRACIDDASPRATLVVGPPGQGKSRLRHELLRRLQGRDLLVLLGLGDPIRTASTCGLLGRALLRHLGVSPDDPEAKRRAAVEDLARRLPEPAHAAAFLGELCGLAQEADVAEDLRAALLDPRVLHQRIGRAWLAFLRAQLRDRPVLLVLDDLQWSDALSLQLVDLALRELGSEPLCVLALARPEAQELFPGLWAPHLAVLPLRPLGQAASTRLIRQVLGDRLPGAKVAALVERAAGNALYVEELIRAADAHNDQIPETVLAMLQARIGLLPAAARRILRAASVLGESFPLPGVREILGEELGSGLELLVKQEIVEAQPDDPGRSHYRFRHVLMRDAAYALLTDEDRIASHAQAAQFLERSGDSAAVIASHYQRGGEVQRAVDWYVVASEQAYRANDMGAAVRLAHAGMAAGATGQARGELQSICAPAAFYGWDFLACWAAATEAVQLLPPDHAKRTQAFAWRACVAMQLNKIDEVAPELHELLDARPPEAQVIEFAVALCSTVVAYVPMGYREHATRLVARLRELDQAMGDRVPMVRGAYHHGLLKLEQMLGDDVHQAWQSGRIAAELYEQNAFFGWWSFVAIEIGDCARRLFSVDEAVAAFRPVLAHPQTLAQPISQAYSEQHLAVLLAEETDQLDEAERLSRSVLALCGAGNAFSAFGHRGLALVLLRKGQLEEAEREAVLGRQEMRTLGMFAYYPHFDATLTKVLLARGDGERAARQADESRAIVDQYAPLGAIELSARVEIARAYQAAGRLDDARAAIRDGLVVLARRRARLDERLRPGFDAVAENAELRAMSARLGCV